MDCLHKQKGPPVGEEPRPADLKYQANRYEYGLSGCKSAIYPPHTAHKYLKIKHLRKIIGFVSFGKDNKILFEIKQIRLKIK